LASSDYYLFRNLKKHLKGRQFSSIEEAMLAVDGWFTAQQKYFFLCVKEVRTTKSKLRGNI
jgi:hypothetical protein